MLVAPVLCGALLAGGTACGGDGDGDAAATPTGTGPAERRKFAKTRFVAKSASGRSHLPGDREAVAGGFKKSADGRTATLIKAGPAGTFAYNRLEAASRNATGDPILWKAVAPFTSGIDRLEDLPSKLRGGESPDRIAQSFGDVVVKVKERGTQFGRGGAGRGPVGG